VLVICWAAGTKRRQQNDIEAALRRWRDYKARKSGRRNTASESDSRQLCSLRGTVREIPASKASDVLLPTCEPCSRASAAAPLRCRSGLSTFGAAASRITSTCRPIRNRRDSPVRDRSSIRRASPTRLHVGGVAISKAPDCDRHHRRRLRIEIVKPPFERAVAGVRTYPQS